MKMDDDMRKNLLIAMILISILGVIFQYFDYKATINQNTGNIEIEYGILNKNHKGR